MLSSNLSGPLDFGWAARRSLSCGGVPAKHPFGFGRLTRSPPMEPHACVTCPAVRWRAAGRPRNSSGGAWRYPFKLKAAGGAKRPPASDWRTGVRWGSVNHFIFIYLFQVPGLCGAARPTPWRSPQRIAKEVGVEAGPRVKLRPRRGHSMPGVCPRAPPTQPRILRRTLCRAAVSGVSARGAS